MSETVIHVGGDDLASMLEGHWRQGSYSDSDGAMCLHGAIRRCCPVPGDAHLIEQVEARLGRWSTDWNDDDNRTEGEVVALARRGWDITDADLAATFGPQWRAVVALVRRAAAPTADESWRLVPAMDAAGDAAGAAAGDAARYAAMDAAGYAARYAARYAAWCAARYAAMDAAGYAARYAARYAAMDAAMAVATWDLATDDGPYTVAMRDLLLAPWVEVCGLPEGLVE